MQETKPQNIDFWIQQISQQEMPALTSTVKALEDIAKDDTASLAKLGQAILHDHALTASVLKVANSSTHMSRNPVTTVSRAAIVLGVTNIKNICITAKLLSSLLKNKNLTPPVYERLLKLMAQAFHAGMLAKMLLIKHDSEVQEEGFIAALLNNVGESAFWSLGGAATEQLDSLLAAKEMTEQEKQRLVTKQLGISFDKMSHALAKIWHLGEVLSSSLSEPQQRTPEIQSIHLAVKLSTTLSAKPKNHQLLNQQLKQAATLLGVSQNSFKTSMQQCTNETVKLLRSYGANVLTQFIPGTHSEQEENIETLEVNRQALQLKILRELAYLPNEAADFNMVIQTALEGIYRAIGLKRAIVLLKNKNNTHLLPRFISAADSHNIKQTFLIDLKRTANIFKYVVKYQQALWIQSHQDPQWKVYLTSEIKSIVSNKGFFIAPINWDNKCIGVFYADNDSTEQSNELSQEDYMAFTLFSQQTNLCLSQILHNK